MSFICIKLSKDGFTPMKIKPELYHAQHGKASAPARFLLLIHQPYSHLKLSVLAVLPTWEFLPSHLFMATLLSFKPQVRTSLTTLSEVTLPLNPISSLGSAVPSLVSEMVVLIHFSSPPLESKPK